MKVYSNVAWVGGALVALAVIIDRTADSIQGGNALVVQGLAIVGAVVTAGVAYQIFSTKPPRSPRVIAAVVSSLIGGASVAAAASSAAEGSALGTGLLSSVGLVGILFGCVALQLEAAARAQA